MKNNGVGWSLVIVGLCLVSIKSLLLFFISTWIKYVGGNWNYEPIDLLFQPAVTFSFLISGLMIAIGIYHLIKN